MLNPSYTPTNIDNNIFVDDAGNFGGSGGSENFVSLDNKNEKEEALLMKEQNENLTPDTNQNVIFDDDNNNDIFGNMFNTPSTTKPTDEENQSKQQPAEEKVDDKPVKENQEIPIIPNIDFETIKQSNNFKQYMKGTVKNTEAVQLYKDLGGTDDKYISAGGKGSISIIRKGISNLLKNEFNYQEKSAKNARYKKFDI